MNHLNELRNLALINTKRLNLLENKLNSISDITINNNKLIEMIQELNFSKNEKPEFYNISYLQNIFCKDNLYLEDFIVSDIEYNEDYIIPEGFFFEKT